MTSQSVLLTVLVAACGGAATPLPVEPPTPLEVTRTSQNKKYTVRVWSEPAIPPMGELFVMKAELRDKKGEIIDDAKVQMNARMPHHNHGMETDPIHMPGVCPPDGGRCIHDGGVYETHGFKFHMGGEWTVTVDVEGPNGFDNTSFVYDLRG
ncbi:MAG: FixH family protein [Myxococcota bacterium]